MMVIGMISGKALHRFHPVLFAAGLGFGRMAGVVLKPKTFTYCILTPYFAYFLIGLLPRICSIPDIGNRRDIVMLLILSCWRPVFRADRIVFSLQTPRVRSLMIATSQSA